jgi:long-chain acyl-CoA synthetase
MAHLDYPSTLKLPVNVHQYESLGALFLATEQKFGHRNALINYGAKMSYAEIGQKSRHLAHYLIHHCQLKKGDRVALFMPNIMQFIVMANAILKAGGVVVNINPLYTTRELTHVLQDATPKVIVFLENFAHILADVDSKFHPEHLIVTELGDCFPWWRRVLVNSVVRYVKKMIPSYKPFAKVTTWLQACAVGKKGPDFIQLDVKSTDIAFLQYTGGTTGVAKGAILTHGNMIANIMQGTAWLDAYFPDVGDFRIATPLPLYHIFSLTANFLIFYTLGSESLLITNARDLKSFIKDWQKYPVQVIAGVNTLFNALLQHPLFNTLPMDKLRLAFAGGMAVQSTVAQAWQERTGLAIVQAYGLTEASPAVCVNPLNQKHFTGSIGLPLPETEIRICNEDNEVVAPGGIGELWIRGPQVMQGYWNQPEETRDVLTEDGWLKSGDMCYQDENGYVFVVDRKKDLIIISGFKVYPSEVESVLIKHPSIKEIAVIAGIDTQGLQVVEACCVIKSGFKFNPEELDAFCRLSLTAYKIPKIYLQVKELPKSNVGKILKKDLKKDISKYLL